MGLRQTMPHWLSEFWRQHGEVEDVHPYFYWVAATMPLSTLTITTNEYALLDRRGIYPNFDKPIKFQFL